jgi:3-deoxy-D-manno-octulosonate 8-phosphate phosphatase (KDO 8-P phosphatase)
MKQADVQNKLQAIRALILDVDGVLASPQLQYSDNGDEIKTFHIRDGMGIQLLLRAGIQVGIISGRTSRATEKRIADIGIQHAFFGQKEKITAYESLKKTFALGDQAIAYMGDDLPDIPLLKRVGLSITLADAPEIVKQHASWHITLQAGNGAVRIVCDALLMAQQQYDTVVQSYLLA